MQNNPSSQSLRECLQFYCVTPTSKNQFMSWRVNSIFDLESRLKYWMNKFYIKAAFYVVYENGQQVSNQKIDLTIFEQSDFREIKFSDLV